MWKQVNLVNRAPKTRTDKHTNVGDCISNKKHSYRRDSARCGCRSTQPRSIIWPISLLNNLRPLNSPIRTTYLSLLAFNSSPSLHTHTPPLVQVEWEKDGLSRWTCFSVSAQNIGLSDLKLKSALKCTVWSQCTPVPDKQTDRRTSWQSRDDSV